MRSESFCSAKPIERFGERLADQHGRRRADAVGGEQVDGPGDPFLAALDEQLLVLRATGMAVRKLLAHDEDDVDGGVEGLGERARQRDAVVAGARGQVSDCQMHCWSCTFICRLS